MAKILAVDDEAKILQIIRKALEKDGHIVQTVQDGRGKTDGVVPI